MTLSLLPLGPSRVSCSGFAAFMAFFGTPFQKRFAPAPGCHRRRHYAARSCWPLCPSRVGWGAAAALEPGSGRLVAAWLIKNHPPLLRLVPLLRRCTAWVYRFATSSANSSPLLLELSANSSPLWSPFLSLSPSNFLTIQRTKQ